jgi:hypothetical protein
VSSIFKPKIKTPDAPPPPETIDEAARQQDYTERLRKRKGRSSTVLVPNTSGGPSAQVLGG